MTPEIEANQLIEKFLRYTPVEFEYEYAVQSALLAVELGINIINDSMLYKQSKRDYWQSVKQILQNKI